ncbi:DUF3078 domain-containing protein [Pontibacter cellulosilyticus]|uniref:DUF3078 domain-containing protein n=1 Tax=Pontibacter cellulosilyticus TaxID=1720253 RepID=A0A923N6H0_9BACT|nr:DUF3078 domain-containing protein [Pontibacter cellulosilyticus]MBC5993795.1 DUF3078 domain-containing protein [Pontibacter cellulosilyticus]
MITSILKNTLYASVLFFLAVVPSFGQDNSVSPDSANIWDFGGTGTINFSQVSLSNWAAGGQSSVSVLGIANVHANYAQGHHTWDNALDITYGTLKLENQRLRKSDDKLELNTKYGHRASEDWFYSAQVNLKTQLTSTYTASRDTILSDFLAPAFVLASLGMDYKPNDKLSVFISPVTGKFTFVRLQTLADRGAFGVEPAERNAAGEIIPGTGERLRKEFGGYVNVRYREEILKNVIFQSKLDLFSNYLQNPENIDVNWENLINFKVNKLISASLFVHMIYDDDINIIIPASEAGASAKKGPRLQVKETLGIGISYSFQ